MKHRGRQIPQFENDVKKYGTQTEKPIVTPEGMFENDVKKYGTQTFKEFLTFYELFENDVKKYGTQTYGQRGDACSCLRMM